MSARTRTGGRATLAQVAARAGVSSATASLVLRGRADDLRISNETRRRVRSAAEELDYVPNLLVHSIQRGSTQIVSFFDAYRRPAAHDDLYMGRLATAVQRATGKLGYDLLVQCDFARGTKETYEFLNGGRADGLLLFAPERDDPLLPLLRRSRLPVVLINSPDEEGILSSVRDDMEQGMRLVAEALLAQGHTRIAILVDGDNLGNQRDLHARVPLLCRYLHEAAPDLPEPRVVPFVEGEDQVLQELLATEDAPTALFCWRDRIAYFAIESLERLKIPVPERVSVIGYDGIVWPAATRHTVASVQVDLEAVALTAVHMLDRCLRTPSGEAVQQILPVSFLRGTTLGPAPCPSKERIV
jgi:LacI family transcriptional regulator